MFIWSVSCNLLPSSAGSTTIITCCITYCIILYNHLLYHPPSSPSGSHTVINCCFTRRHHLLLHSQSSASESLTVMHHPLSSLATSLTPLSHAVSPAIITCVVSLHIRLEWFIIFLHLKPSPPRAADQIPYIHSIPYIQTTEVTRLVVLWIYIMVLICRFNFRIVHCSCL